MEEEFSRRPLTWLRFGSIRKWYRYFYGHCAWAAAGYLAALLSMAAWFGQINECLPLMLIAVHGLFMWLQSVWLRELSDSGVLAVGAVLLEEALWMTIGEEMSLSPAYVLPAWGMYSRSSACMAGGFNVNFVLAVQMAGCVIWILMTVWTMNHRRKIR